MTVKMRGSISYTEETGVGGERTARHACRHLLVSCSKGFFLLLHKKVIAQENLREKWKIIFRALLELFIYRNDYISTN